MLQVRRGFRPPVVRGSAIRLPNGHTVVTSMDPRAVVEFDRAGKELSRFTTPSRPFRVRRY